MRRWFRFLGLIGTMILGTGVTVQAQYQVRPMRLAWTALAGETIRTQMRLINLNPHPARATVTVVNLARNVQGQWMPQDQPLEPNTPGRASCRAWIAIKRSPESFIPLPAAPLKNGTDPCAAVPLTIAIPAAASGSYLAALQVNFASLDHQAVTAINLNYVIPVEIDVLPATIDQVGTPVDHLVTDLTLSPAFLAYQAHPGQSLPATLILINRHSHQAYTATLSPDKTFHDATGRSFHSWIKPPPTGPVALPPQQTQSLEFQVVVPQNALGRFDTTLTLTLSPAQQHGLILEYACLIPLHLEVTQKTPNEPNQPLNSSSLRILNPRPLEIRSKPQACYAQGTLALYSTRPLRLQGPQPGNPWQCSADPNVISSYPLTALCIQGPPQKPQAVRNSPPIVLHISPVSFNLK